METVVLVGGVLGLLTVLVWLVLLLWAAREDGRDQRRRDAAGVRLQPDPGVSADGAEREQQREQPGGHGAERELPGGQAEA